LPNTLAVAGRLRVSLPLSGGLVALTFEVLLESQGLQQFKFHLSVSTCELRAASRLPAPTASSSSGTGNSAGSRLAALNRQVETLKSEFELLQT